MTLDSIREYCLSFPNTKEKVQWGDDLLFLVGGKIFTAVGLDPASTVRVTFKCSPERYAELLEVEGAKSAPYVGRFKWIALEHFNVLPDRELREVIRESYELIASKVPRKSTKARKRTRKAAGR
jgi:predicted DNA-binding protein (MmcQ/YjbR family)